MDEVGEGANGARRQNQEHIGRERNASLAGVRDHPNREEHERDAQVDEDLGAPAAGHRELQEARVAVVHDHDGRVDREGGEDGND